MNRSFNVGLNWTYVVLLAMVSVLVVYIVGLFLVPLYFVGLTIGALLAGWLLETPGQSYWRARGYAVLFIVVSFFFGDLAFGLSLTLLAYGYPVGVPLGMAIRHVRHSRQLLFHPTVITQHSTARPMPHPS